MGLRRTLFDKRFKKRFFIKATTVLWIGSGIATKAYSCADCQGFNVNLDEETSYTTTDYTAGNANTAEQVCDLAKKMAKPI